MLVNYGFERTLSREEFVQSEHYCDYEIPFFD